MAKFTLISIAVSLALVAVTYGLPSTYEHKGSQVLRVPPQGSRDRMQILGLLEPTVDFWLQPSTIRPCDILVTPENSEYVKNFLKTNGFTFTVMIEDVGALIYEQNMARGKQAGDMNWNDYQEYDVIMKFLDDVAMTSSDIATVQVYGNSTEGRALKIIKIGTPGTGKPAMFLDGAMHAREWIGPAILTYIVNELTQNRAANQDILDSVDIYITPIANPDGYAYTQTDRLWRKTRSDQNSTLRCKGVDPNRNFEYAFGGEGTSSDKCSEIYKGPNAWSEPETAAIRDFIEQGGINWEAYFAIHSYAQMWLVPWGWTYDLPPTYTELREFGDIGAAALTAVHGTPYEVGSVTEILTPGAGGSDDWAYGSGNFRYSQTIEVRDTGRYGFVLPPAQIIPTSEETWAGIQAVARFMVKKNGKV